MKKPSKRVMPDRSKINVHDPLQSKSWSRELGISKEQLLEVVDKVGNSAATVRKELEN